MPASKKKAPARATERMVTFEITTTTPLPVGQQVFVSGNIDMLGQWKPDGFPLTRLDDNLWSGYAVIGPESPVEFKLTRGTWDSEEADASGTILKDNHALPASGNVTFTHTVARWLDRA